MGLTVNGVEIAETQIQGEMARLRPEYEAYVRANGGEPSDAQLREWAEENLIEESLFRQAASASQPLPSDERAQAFIDDHGEAFTAVPQEERLARSKEALQQRRMMKELRKAVAQPTEDELRAFYEAHPERFMMPESLRLSHICRFVSPATKADLFLELLRLKTEIAHFRLNWVEAMEACSETFERDRGLFETVWRGDLPPEIEEKLFALNAGEVSDVLELGGHSLHLFKLLIKNPPQKMEFKDVKETLSEVVFEEACQKALEAKFDALKASAAIQRTP